MAAGVLSSYAQAFASGKKTVVLSASEVKILEAIADGIVPGARRAGVAHYIDKQLSVSRTDCLLMLNYLGVPAPYNSFYLTALGSIEKLSVRTFNKGCAAIDADELAQLVAMLYSGDVSDSEGGFEWQGPPAPFFFFVLRADACDVVYGTEQGAKNLKIPYMAHIAPVQNW